MGMLEDDLTIVKLFEALKVEYEYPSEEKVFFRRIQLIILCL